MLIDVSVNETNQHFYSEFSSDTQCFSQDNLSLRKPIKTCSPTSEKDSTFDENCRKKPKLMNNQTDVSINNINHQFCVESPSDKKCKFPPHATVKNEHQSLNLKSTNQSEVSKNCREKPMLVKHQTNDKSSHSSTITNQSQADITVTCEKPKTWVNDLHFWSLHEKSQLFWCSIMKLPIITEHTERPLKLLGKPSKLFRILGDGNCLFRALSHVITGRQVYHAQGRNKIINHMTSIENFLVPHLNTSLECYLHKTRMAQSGVWGTDIEIVIASSLLSTDIFVYTKFGDTYKWQKFSRTMLGGQKPENNCSIYLNHTNSVKSSIKTSTGIHLLI